MATTEQPGLGDLMKAVIDKLEGDREGGETTEAPAPVVEEAAAKEIEAKATSGC